VVGRGKCPGGWNQIPGFFGINDRLQILRFCFAPFASFPADVWYAGTHRDLGQTSPRRPSAGGGHSHTSPHRNRLPNKREQEITRCRCHLRGLEDEGRIALHLIQPGFHVGCVVLQALAMRNADLGGNHARADLGHKLTHRIPELLPVIVLTGFTPMCQLVASR